MTEQSRGVIIAPSKVLLNACGNGLTSTFDLGCLDSDVVHTDADLAAAFEAKSLGEASLMVIGDGVFPPLESPDASLKRGLQISFLAAKCAVRGMMRRRYGRIIAVAPRVNKATPPRFAAVGALAGLMRSVAREVGSRGITANVVVMGSDGDDLAALSPYTAVPRPMLPDDLRSVLAFLSSDQASYFTGQVLLVDGGLGSS